MACVTCRDLERAETAAREVSARTRLARNEARVACVGLATPALLSAVRADDEAGLAFDRAYLAWITHRNAERCRDRAPQPAPRVDDPALIVDGEPAPSGAAAWLRDAVDRVDEAQQVGDPVAQAHAALEAREVVRAIRAVRRYASSVVDSPPTPRGDGAGRNVTSIPEYPSIALANRTLGKSDAG